LNEIGRVVITTVKPIFFDSYKKNRNTGSFVLIDPVSHNTCAVGMIIDKIHADGLPQRITDADKVKIDKGISLISKDEYQNRYNQKGATIWITGLHGSGKNQLAYLLEKQLFAQNATVVLFDGSTVRSGLSRELDYSPADRAENLRRVAEVCKLLNDQGIITICSFISADENVRKQVSKIVDEDNFTLVYMDATLDYCKQNKPQLYKLVEDGIANNLPGVDCPYDVPTNADIICKPINLEDDCTQIIAHLVKKKIFPIA
jgi:bifunctional enzyme CysN/CysC